MKRHLLQKCLVMVGGEGTTHTEQSVFFSFFFSLFLCFLHSSSSFFLFLHLLCFFFLMGHWKHTHTHTQVEKCLINFYKMNTCVITTEVEKQNSITSRNFPSALSNSKFFHHPRRKCNPQFDHFYLFKGQTQISLLIP